MIVSPKIQPSAMNLSKSLAVAALVITCGLALPATAQTCPALLNHTFAKLQDDSPQNLCQYSGQVILVVNTASYCGFTPQYEGLEQLYAQYGKRGFTILGLSVGRFRQPGKNQQQGDRRVLLQHLRREVPDVRQELGEGVCGQPAFRCAQR